MPHQSRSIWCMMRPRARLQTSLPAKEWLGTSAACVAYGCGLRAGEVVRLRAGDIDSEQMIIRIVQSKGRKDRHVMLPAEVREPLRQWWKGRPTSSKDGVAQTRKWRRWPATGNPTIAFDERAGRCKVVVWQGGRNR